MDNLNDITQFIYLCIIVAEIKTKVIMTDLTPHHNMEINMIHSGQPLLKFEGIARNRMSFWCKEINTIPILTFIHVIL